MNPNYPVYIVSKGRWQSRLTAKALDKIAVPYRIVVEKGEYDEYAAVIERHKILVLPERYQETYDTCDDLGQQKVGPGAARNFCWEHSLAAGAERHWVLDDNITGFHRLNRNLMVKVTSGTIFKAAEDFVDRYENVAIAGFNYDFFAKAKHPIPAFVPNTRIYSCLLIDNSLPIRWRGRYNEDTDLSLRVLKAGLCTIQFNAFLQQKTQTQTMKGGNTDVFYRDEGTKPKSEMLVQLHPDVSRMVWRFERWHHHVDYKPFKRNRLVRKPINISDEVNEYGMILKNWEAS